MFTKFCSKCKKELPATIEFFHRGNRKFGLKGQCKICTKEYYEINKNRILKQCKIYRRQNRDKILEIQRKYSKTEKARKIQKKHREINKLSYNISSAISNSIRGNKNGHHWEDLVDYTLEELRQHLEFLFQEGMCWKNYGVWHIDHIKPKSLFNISSYNCKDFKECWSLDNLQPLWAEDNLRKGCKL